MEAKRVAIEFRSLRRAVAIAWAWPAFLNLAVAFGWLFDLVSDKAGEVTAILGLTGLLFSFESYLLAWALGVVALALAVSSEECELE